MEAVQGHFTPQREQLGLGEGAQTLAPSLRCEAKPTDPRHGFEGLPPHPAPQLLGVEGPPGLGKGLGQLQGTCPGRRGERAPPLPVLWCLRALLTGHLGVPEACGSGCLRRVGLWVGVGLCEALAFIHSLN